MSSFVCFRIRVFFFKQKTAYEMRISDWSSDVCSSDLRTTLELGLWVDPGQRAKLVEAIKARGEMASMEVELQASNGQIHNGLLSAQKVELEGQPYLLSTFLDTTEHKLAEQALKDSQERLALALDSAQLGTWDWHIPSAMLYGTARAAQLHSLAIGS